MPEILFSRCIGDSQVFAVEFEVISHPLNPPTDWREWWGYLWLWVSGQKLGDPDESELIKCGLDELNLVANATGTKTDEKLSLLSPELALQRVLETLYGKIAPSDVGYAHFAVLSSNNPFFDNWDAILMGEGSNERFIWRRKGTHPCEVRWPLGTFRNVIANACAEFEQLAMLFLQSNGRVN